ncbi:hypothetical protein FSP39_009819 [Pinctada imbricata]|uniref:G-protein coupled receptors family 1 profile domain-containing protein n=1 Tax=Pinctada imbricata TaxID=66713 RepID=A0AA88XYR7_PINIB|nr:hypothetical protein FSP39_009819 [Pinctada imbricata]
MRESVMNNTEENIGIDIHQKEYDLYLQEGVDVVIFLATLCVLGTIGNLHVLVVYQKQYKISNFKLFIIVLALNDLLTCILSIPFEIVRTRYKFTFQVDVFCKISRFFVYIFSNTCGLILSFIAVERCRKICAPFRRQLSHRMVTIAVVCLFVFSALLSVPTLLYCKILDKPLPDHGNYTGSHCACEKNLLYTVHQGIILGISTIALIVVLVSYILTARVVFKTRNFDVFSQDDGGTSVKLVKMNSLTSSDNGGKENKKDKNNSKPVEKTLSKKSLLHRSSSKARSQYLNRAIRNTIILMVATIISYIGILPVFIIGILQAVDSGIYEVVEDQLGSAKSILTRLYFLSGVMHPFVYLVMDRTFRGACRDIYVNCIRNISCRKRTSPS